MKETVYDKIRRLKESLEKDVGTFEDSELSVMLGKLERWYYPKKRKAGMVLTKDELKVYEFLIGKKYNPSTCYKWFLACNAVGDVARKLREGTIGLKEALRGARPFKMLSPTETDFMFHVKSIIEKYVIR